MDPRHVPMPEAEVRDRVESVAWQQLLRARALEGDERELECPIFDLNVGGRVLAKPTQVPFAIRRVDDDEEALASAVHHQVIDDPALLVAHEVVLGLTMDERGDVIGDQALQKLPAGCAGDAKTSHV